MLEILPPVSEVIYDAVSTVTVGFTFTGRVPDHFIHLPVFSKHVNLGFTHGASLEDPEGRLVGDGSPVRHIRLTSLELLEDPYVRDLIEQAAARAPRPKEPVTPSTIVKVMAGGRRRPRPVR
jgi:hypothetical protein